MSGITGFNNMHFSVGRYANGQMGEMLDQGISTSNRVSQPRGSLTGPVAILWDIENCPVPGEVSAEDVAGNIRMALRVHPAVKGAVTMFSAYGDFNHFPRRLREGCQRTGVNLIDVPNGKKDASDKAILVDMFLFALDNPPPCTILLISGDVDFAPALHKLGQRGYSMVLAIPAGVGVSSVLCSAGRFVWDWPSVARGEGLVPAKTFLNRFGEPRLSDMSSYMGTAWQSGDDSDLPTEDEQYLYKRQVNHNNVLPGHGETSQFSTATSLSHAGAFPFDMSKLTVNQVPLQRGMPFAQGFPAGDFQINQASAQPSAASLFGGMPPSSAASSHAPQMPADYSTKGETKQRGQPGDLQCLKGQLVRILKMNRGEVQLVRLPSEYSKLFGRPLYLAEYGSSKLVHLIERMSDAFYISGDGSKKTLHLKETMQAQLKHRRTRANVNTNQKDKMDCFVGQVSNDGDDYSEEIVMLQQQSETGSDDEKTIEVNEESDETNKTFECLNEEGKASDEDASDGDAYTREVMLEVFKQEVQELLVSHACAIPLSNFETLYKQRYARELDITAFGVEELETLFVKLEDITTIKLDKASRKFLVARHDG
ncbi:hypothetical protein KP509_22G071200 [Ceratopteris richardii]|uniref:HTH OST-type domain-containing protein n=1 Tax=Ceratopteris richardii TaxID=49495 RepID=A0A8T2S8X9_CERRI|nr:hypothetical protein KP509_22G071200 [Ceratopteris richardii]KAH7307659.1 hypothetical protein KP509_22G071200 [Ceratopteris richardii]KAH7307660.1 hypothetical protein KP509_22G071200 [Ceratopteris richardii]KAH7307661.1 hypothetical protein KP509_22G071200 [Ceratopteris richardii]KAH7307662.1 hypothetical protein KP509_22G071200 [Ceratopteris richardii]